NREIGVALSAITKRPANQSNCQHDEDHSSGYGQGAGQRASWMMPEIRGNKVVHTPPVRGKRPDDYSGARNAKKEIVLANHRRAAKNCPQRIATRTAAPSIAPAPACLCASPDRCIAPTPPPSK